MHQGRHGAIHDDDRRRAAGIARGNLPEQACGRIKMAGHHDRGQAEGCQGVKEGRVEALGVVRGHVSWRQHATGEDHGLDPSGPIDITQRTARRNLAIQIG